MTKAVSITIAAPVETVWAKLAAFGQIAEWAPNVSHSVMQTDGPISVGAVRRVQAGRQTLLETIIAWQPGEQLSYKITGLPPLIDSVVSTWQLVSDGPSKTTASLETVFGPGTLRPLKALVATRFTKAAHQMLGGLSDVCSKGANS